jgi:hypothetical protein
MRMLILRADLNKLFMSATTKLVVIVSFFISIFLLGGIKIDDTFIIIAVSGCQSSMGAIIWKRFISQRSANLIELIGMGGAIGFALSLLSSQLFRTLLPKSFSWVVLPFVGVLICAKLPRLDNKSSNSESVFTDYLLVISATLFSICSIWNWLIPIAGSYVLLVTWCFWRFDICPSQRMQVLIANLIGVCGALLALTQLKLLFNIEDYRSTTWWNLTRGTRQYPDSIFNESMVNSVQRYGNTDNIFMFGSGLNYHWLSFAWQATVGSVSALEPFVVTGIASIPILLFVTMCIVWSISRLVFGGKFAAVAVISVLSMVCSRFIQFMAPINIYSSSYSFALIFVFALIFIFLNYPVFSTLFRSVLIILSTIVVIGSKASTLPLIGGGLLFIAIDSLVSLSTYTRRNFVFIASSAIALTLSFVYFYMNGTNPANSQFSLSIGSLLKQQGPLAHGLPFLAGFSVSVLVLLTFMFPIFGLSQLKDVIGSEWRPGFMFAIGGGFSSLILAFILFNNLEGTQYFAQAGLAVLIPFSVGALVSKIEIREEWPFIFLAAVMILSFVTTFVTWHLYANTQGDSVAYFYKLSLVLVIPIIVALSLGLIVRYSIGLRERLSVTSVAIFFLICGSANSFLINVPEFYRLGHEFREIKFDEGDLLIGTADFRELLFWLRDNSAEDDLVATNRQCVDLIERPPACSGLWSLTSAIANRQNLVEGVYPHGSSKVERGVRQKMIDEFVNHSSSSTRNSLVDYGVRWVVADYAVTNARSWGEFAEVRFENKAGAILELVP